MTDKKTINLLLVDDHPLVRDGLRASWKPFPIFTSLARLVTRQMRSKWWRFTLPI
jgi:hypothetical protein